MGDSQIGIEGGTLSTDPTNHLRASGSTLFAMPSYIGVWHGSAGSYEMSLEDGGQVERPPALLAGRTKWLV